MIRPFTSSLVATLAVLAVAGCASPAAVVKPLQTASGAAAEYRVRIPDTASETFHVDATLSGVQGDTVAYFFPVWAPGAYDIVNYGAYVTSFSAKDANGERLTVLRGDTNTFRIVGGKGRVTVSYDVHDIEHVPNSAWFGLSDIESDFAFANGTALFGYAGGYKDIPHKVAFEVPRGWQLAVALDPAEQSFTYVASSYDELADAPVQMGAFQRLEFQVGDVPHIITVTAPETLHDTIAAELVETTRRIVVAMSDLFGDMPYKRYLFQHYLAPPRSSRYGFGALEHANSSTYRMPYYGQDAVASSLAAVIAHEYWHLWSPKRIHVHQLGPFDYQQGPVTASLWFAEGLTEYYARAITSRIGLSQPQGFLEEFHRDMSGLYRRPQFEQMTALSRRITSAPTTELIDLYKKGPLIGYLLDAEIRWQTDNRKSLDDAMRWFNNEFARRGLTFSDEDIIPIMERATGAELSDFYSRYIAGRDTLPFDAGFKQTGLMYVVRDTIRPTLGALLEPSRLGMRVAQVYENSSAAAMGLRVGDIVNTLDFQGYAIPLNAVPLEYVDEFFSSVVEGSPAGTPEYMIRTLSITRDGNSEKLPAIVRPGPSTVERLDVDPGATAKALTIRRAMIGF